MATAETVTWESDARAPEELEKLVFKDIKDRLKRKLLKRFHDAKKAGTDSFVPVENLTDEQITDFSEEDLVQVRIASVAFGRYLFGKVLIPASEKGYFHFKAYLPKTGETVDEIKIAEASHADVVHAEIFSKTEPLEFFNI